MLTKFLDLAMERTARGKNGRKRKGWSPSFSFNFFFVSSSLGRIVLGLVEKFRQLTLKARSHQRFSASRKMKDETSRNEDKFHLSKDETF